MASEAIVDERLIPFYYISQSISLLLTILLFIFHIFRIKHNAKRSNVSRGKSIKLFSILDLRTVSYLILLSIILNTFIFLSAISINLIHVYLTDWSCQFISYIQTTFILSSRFFFHLFVAIRSRFSSHRRKFNIYGKIGLCLIIVDIALIFAFWIAPNQQVVELSDNRKFCVPVSYGTLYVVWVLLNDIIITPYCLIAFVVPLLGIIRLEKQQLKEHMRVHGNFKKNEHDLSMANLVRKIIICNTIAMLQILLQCGLASNGFTGNYAGNILHDICLKKMTMF